MKFKFEELVKATNAKVLLSTNTSGTFSICTDSRKINTCDIYIPLKGENFDGHDFIENAVLNGARGYFTSNETKIVSGAKFALYVENTLIAYMQIALMCKKKINPITVAITGSSGKTTTKEMMASVLSESYKIHKTALNHNNEVGQCQTILSMPEDTEVLILEMGMRGLGEIELLSKYSEPDIALIINTGTTHIGRLGTVRNIAKAKCEISKYLHEEGLLIAHDTELIRKVNKFKGHTLYVSLESPELRDINLHQNSSDFVYKNSKYTLNIEGKHNIQNALFVINTALRLGMSAEKIAAGLAKFKPIEKRWEVLEISGLKIINDSYNSNPESLKAAISTFLSTQEPPRWLVLGDMKELGKQEKAYHKEAGEFLNKFKDVKLITVGELAKFIAKTTIHEHHCFSCNSEAAKFIKENVEADSIILFKASRSMKFEEIIRELSEK